MNNKFYISNRQKLLFMVEELHKKGFERLRIIPSLSPSGMYWRCSFIDKTRNNKLIVSNWITNHEKNSGEKIKLTTQELAKLFIKENSTFIEYCKGKDQKYSKWYSYMLKQLEKDELPYAFADWEIPKGIWITSKNNQIKTLDIERKFYF